MFPIDPFQYVWQSFSKIQHLNTYLYYFAYQNKINIANPVSSCCHVQSQLVQFDSKYTYCLSSLWFGYVSRVGILNSVWLTFLSPLSFGYTIPFFEKIILLDYKLIVLKAQTKMSFFLTYFCSISFLSSFFLTVCLQQIHLRFVFLMTTSNSIQTPKYPSNWFSFWGAFDLCSY